MEAYNAPIRRYYVRVVEGESVSITRETYLGFLWQEAVVHDARLQ